MLTGIIKPFVNADGTKDIAVANQDTVYTNAIKIEYAEFFGLWVIGTSTPDMKIELEMGRQAPTTERAADAALWVVPENVGDIFANMINTAAPKIISLSPAPMPYMRLKITGNAGNGANATLQAHAFLQYHSNGNL